MENSSFENTKAIFFDLDETLIDAPQGLKAAHNKVAERICEYIPCEKHNLNQNQISEKLSNFDDQMNLERKYDRNSWWPEFLRKLGFEEKLNQSQIERLTKLYWNSYAEAAVPYSSSNAVIQYLDEKGYSLGIVTDTDGSDISKRDRMSDLDFFDLFEVIVVAGEDTSASKPNPGPFELAASKLDVDGNMCVMVGDKPFTDVKGANSAGMKTILIKRRDWDAESDPDLTINSLEELKEIF